MKNAACLGDFDKLIYLKQMKLGRCTELIACQAIWNYLELRDLEVMT